MPDAESRNLCYLSLISIAQIPLFQILTNLDVKMSVDEIDHRHLIERLAESEVGVEPPVLVEEVQELKLEVGL